jgi:hypothetical protein
MYQNEYAIGVLGIDHQVEIVRVSITSSPNVARTRQDLMKYGYDVGSDNRYRIIPFSEVLFVQRMTDVIEDEGPVTEIWVNMGHDSVILFDFEEGTRFMDEYARWLQNRATRDQFEGVMKAYISEPDEAV